MGARTLSQQDRPLCSLHGMYPDQRNVLAKCSGNTSKGRPRSATGYERIDPRLHLSGDFPAGAQLMNNGVKRVLKLAREKISGITRGHVSGHLDTLPMI